MGHEAIIYGAIVGSRYKTGSEFRLLQDRNTAVIKELPADNDWPWVDKDVFALPGAYPTGAYRSQIIHVGLSIKEDPPESTWFDVWLLKFEAVLKKLYWDSARLHIESDFYPRREILWVPTSSAVETMFEPPHLPISEWTRSIKILGSDSCDFQS